MLESLHLSKILSVAMLSSTNQHIHWSQRFHAFPRELLAPLELAFQPGLLRLTAARTGPRQPLASLGQILDP